MTNFVKILDCTLRDGGYNIDWNFGSETIKSILQNLEASEIDFIECGFLKESVFCSDKSFFSSIQDLEPLISKKQNYTLMVNFGEYSIENFHQCNTPNIKIRVAFKKHNQDKAIEYISKLKNLGWDVFANPMSTNTYNSDELKSLIDKINKITPYGLSIVDTLGNMYEKQVIEIFNLIHQNLLPQIAIGFHSHNSLQLSFANTKALLRMKINREIIIDSCVYGMGRGAGNLCTELITKYLNDNYKTNYKIFPILEIIDKNLKPIYQDKPWGYSTPYYIAAIRGCHPNYASYLVSKGISDAEIDKILSKIPDDKKSVFDITIIEE